MIFRMNFYADTTSAGKEAESDPKRMCIHVRLRSVREAVQATEGSVGKEWLEGLPHSK